MLTPTFLKENYSPLQSISQKFKSNVIIISQSRCATLRQLYHFNSSRTGLQSQPIVVFWNLILRWTESTISHCIFNQMMTFLRQWRRLVLSAVKLNQIFHTINIFNIKRRIIMIKKTIQRNHMFASFALLLNDAIFGYWPLPRFSLIPSTDLKDGYCNFMVSYVCNIVFFFAI